MAPDPVPTSAARPVSPSGPSRARATSTMISVSGRGIRTRRSTLYNAPANSRVPVRYATGSARTRRRISARKRRHADGATASLSRVISAARSHPKTARRRTSASRPGVSVASRPASISVLRPHLRTSPTEFGRFRLVGPLDASPVVALIDVASRGGEAVRLIGLAKGTRQAIDCTRHHTWQVVHRQADAMIGHAILREIIRADLFVSIA